jgi:hypothetical protein
VIGLALIILGLLYFWRVRQRKKMIPPSAEFMQYANNSSYAQLVAATSFTSLPATASDSRFSRPSPFLSLPTASDNGHSRLSPPDDQPPPPFSKGNWNDPVIEKAMDSLHQQQEWENNEAAHDAIIGHPSYTKN